MCRSWVHHIYRLATALFQWRISVRTLRTRKTGKSTQMHMRVAQFERENYRNRFGATASRGLQVVCWYCANKSAAALGCHEQAICHPSTKLCLLRNGDLLEMFISSRCCGVDGLSLLTFSRLLFVISYKLHTDQWETSTLVGFLRIISAR